MNRRFSKNFLVAVILGLLVFGIGESVSALTYQYGIGVSFTFNPALIVTVSADLKIDNLAPGTVSDSNIITVNVLTNSMYGYTLNATVGNDTTYDTRDLIHTNSQVTDKFTSVAYSATPTIASNTSLTDNTWAYSYSVDNGTNWANYNGLPKYDDTTNFATLKSTNGPVSDASGDNVKFKIAARASANQPSGTYNNVINFIAVATPEPTPQPIECGAGKICYAPNAIGVDDTMGDQTASASTNTVLWPSNFQRDGYGFIGWNTELDGSGTMYGPMETITTPSTLGTEGLALYATWVQASDYMQNWSGCSSMSIGDVTALTDLRDDDTYAVAKLADGKCWMIENLRLDSTAAHNSDGTMAQGYNSSFVGLANAESAWDTSSSNTTANSLYSTNGSGGTTAITGSNQAYRFPRYNNTNTNNTTTNQTNNSGSIYSYGNYYTWSAVVADTSDYGTNNQSITTTSICPTGWRLPQGGNKTRIESDDDNDFWNLIVDGLNNSTNPANYGSYTQPYYNGSTDAGPVSNALRSFPNNFLYSGNVSSSLVDSRGSSGSYWSSTVYGSSSSYYLLFHSVGVYPGASNTNKYGGYAARCLVGS